MVKYRLGTVLNGIEGSGQAVSACYPLADSVSDLSDTAV